MKTTAILVIAIVLTVVETHGLESSSDVLEETHRITRRFAELGHEFTTHEIVEVFHEQQTNSFHRISKRDLRSVSDQARIKRIRLNLASGSQIHLHLKKRSLLDPDTEIYENTEHGVTRRDVQPDDCYATGEVDVDGHMDGTVAAAVCNGLHGTATSNGIEYYIYPVTNDDGSHMVHILSRRYTGHENSGDSADAIFDTIETNQRNKREVDDETYKNATSFVIEMAVFVDAKYYAIIHKKAPGREDEYILMGIAATNAIFSDRDKVGYDAAIKVKLLVHWIVDPDEYKFNESIFDNLKSFCIYTRDKYNYDMHFLHTGVTKQSGPAVGVAYAGGVCTKTRCINILGTSISRYNVMAHEIGHNLGFSHHGAAKCPADVKNQGNGFMGSGGSNFSPCNKWELQNFFSKGKGQCLFEETGKVSVPKNYANQPPVFPGQYKSPDEQCRIRVGEEFEYYRPFELTGTGECAVFLCINRNKESPEYLRVVRNTALMGFPCGDEMYCMGGHNCNSLDNPNLGWNIEYLREMKQAVSWSDWSQEWSECSGECGTGVQIKRRRCNIDDGLFLSAYCRGPSIQARLCNQEPCAGDPISLEEIRQARGNEVCARFFNNNVTLRVAKGSSYLPTSRNIWIRDASNRYYKSTTCMLMCERSPLLWNYLDGFYPDGTPCSESKKSIYARKRFNIDLRCVQGMCTEMSDCPGNQEKDMCGICGGDPVHCVSKVIDKTYDIPEEQTTTIATMPAGSSRINIRMIWWKNKDVRFQVFNANGEIILGAGGMFKRNKYTEANAVEYAGTKWIFEHASYIQADGPIDQEIVVKVSRKIKPVTEIFTDFLLPSGD